MSCDSGNASSARRRAWSAGVQGIDYIDVLDFATTDQELRWRILLIYCFDDVNSLTRANLSIEYAPDSAPLSVEWAYSGENLEKGNYEGDLWLVDEHGNNKELEAEQLNELIALSNGDEKILVAHIRHVVAPADNKATYTLVRTGDGTPIDPRLAVYQFTIHAEGPVEFDCAATPRPALARPPGPPIDYLAKDYASFRRLMLDRMAVVMPEWQERTVADIGVALIEILAYVGDHLSYYQDAVGTEAYLGTARRRISVRRHSRLLDYTLHEGNNARVWICLEVDEDFADPPDGEDDLRLIPAGTRLVTKLKNETEPVLADNVVGEALLQDALFFETVTAILPRPVRNRIAVYDWGHGVDCIPQGATCAALDRPAVELDLKVGDVLVLEEIDDEDEDSEIQADSSHRHAVCITEVTGIRDALEDRDVTRVTWHEDDALPFSLPMRHASGKPAAVACGNVVLADHGRTVDLEPLVPDEPPQNERYRPRLAGLNVTHSAPLTASDQVIRSARAQLEQDPSRAVPAVEVYEVPEGEQDEDAPHTIPWHPRRDLLASGPFDRHVAIEMEIGGIAHLRFGDNMYGRRPSPRSLWQATYRVGNGSAGNIGADAITHMLASDESSAQSQLIRDGVTRVRNPLPAVGGSDPERDEQARLYAPYAFRQGERAVTSEDYAKITERHPDVQKAIAEVHWTGSWNTVFVTVDRRGGRPIDIEFEAELRSFLEPFRMAGQDLEFQPPDFVPLDIRFTIHVGSDHLRSQVHSALIEALGDGETAAGKRGFFHPDNFTFGESLYLSHLVAAIMKVPGVEWVDVDDTPPKANRFRRLGEPSRGEVGLGRIAVGPLQIVRVDNDPTAPQNGQLRMYMEGGL
ncbi:MAG: putative baseplate assembly protein [Proteobacteria bacterium]|nr:putative baseplate assembly protein [Pseudomonadota bacterium]